MIEYVKDPNAVLDYTIDLAPWLPDGDTITAATGTTASGDVVVDSTIHDDTTATVWVSGGTVDTNAKVTVHVTTAAGREDDRTLTFRIRQR